MRKVHDAEPPGPDLPPAHEPITGDAYTYRWPMGAEKVELDDGCPYFYGHFDHRDVETAERAFPGRRAVIEPHTPDETRWGNLKIVPAPRFKLEPKAVRGEADRESAMLPEPAANHSPLAARRLAAAVGWEGVPELSDDKLRDLDEEFEAAQAAAGHVHGVSQEGSTDAQAASCPAQLRHREVAAAG